MDSLKYYLAITAACTFTLTPCSAKEALGEAVQAHRPAAQPVAPARVPAMPVTPADTIDTAR